jgi:hypothetical protein
MTRLLVIATLLLAGCARGADARAAAPMAAPRITHRPSDFPFDFTLDQTVEATARGRTQTVRVIAEKSGDTLRLVGLTPFGVRAYVITQEGLDVRAEVQLEGGLPFPPEHVVLDLHRTFLAGFPADAGATPDGRREFTAGGDAFADEIRGGRVVRRRVVPAEPGADVLDVRYEPEGVALDGTPPPRAVVHHERLGYTLVITTTSSRRLASP